MVWGKSWNRCRPLFLHLRDNMCIFLLIANTITMTFPIFHLTIQSPLALILKFFPRAWLKHDPPLFNLGILLLQLSIQYSTTQKNHGHTHNLALQGLSGGNAEIAIWTIGYNRYPHLRVSSEAGEKWWRAPCPQFWALDTLVRCIQFEQGQVFLAEFFIDISMISQPLIDGSISVGTKQFLKGEPYRKSII